MSTTKLNIGKIPISKGEYQEGTTYQRLNQVTMLGSTYQSKIDDNTSAPAQMGADGAVENINTDKWLCIAVGNVSAAKKVVYNNETSGLEAGNVQEAIDEVGSKVSDLSDKCKSFAENIIFGSKYNTENNPIFSVSNYAIFGTDDIYKVGTGYAVTNKIPVSEGDKFYLRVDGLQEACAYVIYYDNGTYKKSKKTDFDGIITIDKGATHIRFGVSSRTSKLDLYKIHDIYFKNRGEIIENSSLLASRNTIDTQMFSIDDTAIYGEGSDITSNLKGYKVSKKIPISKGDIFYMYVDNIGSAYAYCLYYADGTYKRFGKYTFNGLIKIEDEAQYIRFGCGTTGSICRLMKVYPGVLNFVNKSDILQELGESSDKIVSQKAINDAINNLKNTIESIATKKFDVDNIILSKIASNSKVLAFGDSITYGVSSTSQYECGNIKDENEKSYKYIDVFTKKANIRLTNMAISGATATDNTVSNRDFMKNQIERAKSFSADFVLVAIGTNDYGVSEGDNLGSLKTNILDVSNAEYQTFYGALNSEIRLIKQTWANANIFLIAPISRYNINDKSTKSLYWYRKAIYEIAVINQCSFINGEKLIFPSDNQYAGKGEIADILLADGLHPTSLGHKLMGEKLANLLQ